MCYLFIVMLGCYLLLSVLNDISFFYSDTMSIRNINAGAPNGQRNVVGQNSNSGFILNANLHFVPVFKILKDIAVKKVQLTITNCCFSKIVNLLKCISFEGRSSWSSSECFKLKVEVRPSDCGEEGSICSGKGICFANESMVSHPQ